VRTEIYIEFSQSLVNAITPACAPEAMTMTNQINYPMNINGMRARTFAVSEIADPTKNYKYSEHSLKVGGTKVEWKEPDNTKA